MDNRIKTNAREFLDRIVGMTIAVQPAVFLMCIAAIIFAVISLRLWFVNSDLRTEKAQLKKENSIIDKRLKALDKRIYSDSLLYQKIKDELLKQKNEMVILDAGTVSDIRNYDFQQRAELLSRFAAQIDSIQCR